MPKEINLFIVGGVLLAAALVALYSAVVHYIEERGANKESGWED